MDSTEHIRDIMNEDDVYTHTGTKSLDSPEQIRDTMNEDDV
jgi:hypothetical protein